MSVEELSDLQIRATLHVPATGVEVGDRAVLFYLF